MDGVNRIRPLRQSRGLTQEALSDLSGVDQATISLLERGLIENPMYRTLRAIAEALGVSTDALLVVAPPRDRRAAERRTGTIRRERAERRCGLDRRQKVTA